jgi:hypothetical protein
MLRRSVALLLPALCAMAALASAGANASRVNVPDILSVEPRPFSATVAWRVPAPARVVVEVGVDDRYGIWSPSSVAARPQTGKTALNGLEPATTYRFRVLARWGNGSRTAARGSFRTDPWPHAPSAVATPSAARQPSSSGGSPWILPPALPPGSSPGAPPPGPRLAPKGTPGPEASAPLLVNGHAIFPRMVWRQCPTYYPTSLGAGINMFLGVACDTPEEGLSRLSGRGLATIEADNANHSGPAVVGWHLPDEADVSVGLPSKVPEPKADGRVTFLTLTDKFSAGAAPGPYGKDHYPEWFRRADVIGFDTYPVEVRCSVEQIDNVYWMQRELIQLTGGKPTFQWIEAGPMEHCRENADPSPAIVRVETWLAIAGGARGIGYFPDYWVEDIRNEVRQTNREILALAPALLSPSARAGWSAENPVRIAVRRLNGAIYVIAANSSAAPATASFTVAGLGGRKLTVFRDGRVVKSMGDFAIDRLPGHGVAVYVVPPAGW